MGIRFRCHHCEHELNLKEFQAGRRGRCPACSGRFRIPAQSTTFSLALEEQEEVLATRSHRDETFNLKPSAQDTEAQSSRVPTGRGRSPKSKSTAGHGRRAGRSLDPATVDPATVDPAAVDPAAVDPAAVDPATGQPNQGPASQPASDRVPTAVSEAPHAVWYVRPPSGGQYGPADAHAFLSWLQDNRVSADSLVWRDGWPQWMVAGEALEDHFGSHWRLAQVEEAEVSTSAAGPSTAGPSTAGPSTAGPSTANPSTASPSTASSNTAGPSTLGGSLASFGTNSPVFGQEAEGVRQPLQMRRKKQQINYAIFIAIMAILAIALAVVLARVLLK